MQGTCRRTTTRPARTVRMRWATAVGPGVTSMNTTLISALAAFGGSSVGALAPVLSSYVLRRAAAQRELSNRQIALREALYFGSRSPACGQWPSRHPQLALRFRH